MAKSKKETVAKKIKSVSANKYISDEEDVIVSRNLNLPKEKSLIESVIQSRNLNVGDKNIESREDIKKSDQTSNDKIVSKTEKLDKITNEDILVKEEINIKEVEKEVKPKSKKIRTTKTVKKTKKKPIKKEVATKEKSEKVEEKKIEKVVTEKLEKQNNKQEAPVRKILDKPVKQKEIIEEAKKKLTFKERFLSMTIKGNYELRYKGIKIYDSFNSDKVIEFSNNYISIGNKKYPYVGTRLINK